MTTAEASLQQWVLQVNYGLESGEEKMLKQLLGHAVERDEAIVLGIISKLVWFEDCNDIRSIPVLGEVEC